MKHALVVGGSGMLSNTSLWLADNGYMVSVIGRSSHKLSKLTEMSKNIRAISVDYNNERELRSEIHHSITTQEPYEVVVAWIHSNDKKVIDIISDEIGRVTSNKWGLFHVLGSSENLGDIVREIDHIENCEYHQVQLGFMIDNNKSRWLFPYF